MWCSAGSTVALVNHHADTVPARQKMREDATHFASAGDGLDLHLTLSVEKSTPSPKSSTKRIHL